MCRKLAYLLAFVLLLSLSAPTEGTVEVAHWRLDNDATDSVGGIDGTLMNGAGFTTDAVVGSHALVLDGTDDYVEFDDSGLPEGDAPRTMSVWVKPEGTGVRSALEWGTNATTQRCAILILDAEQIKFCGEDADVTSNGSVVNGEWHYVTETYDGTTIRIYIDGVLDKEQAMSINTVLGVGRIGANVRIGEFFNGAIDDVRIYSGVLTPKQVEDLFNGIPPNFNKAYGPDPPDGTENWLSPLLTWKSGETAKFHDVYLGTNPTPGVAEFKFRQPLAYAMWYEVAGWVPGNTYYWRIDEVEADGTTIHTGDVWSFSTAPLAAYNPDPPDGAKYVATDVDLNWSAGSTAITHDVYFGTDETAVTDGTGGTSKGNQQNPPYDPGVLAKDTTYYWRIDEVEAGGTTKHTGDVWRFKTLPEIPISDPNLVAWWKLDEDSGTTVIDWSGYGHHGSFRGDTQWVAGYDGGALEFDGNGDYVEFDDSGLPEGDAPRTMSVWVKPEGAGIRSALEWGTNAATQRCAILILAGEQIKFCGQNADVESNGSVVNGEWHCVTETYDGTNIRIYIDGVLDIEQAMSINTVLGVGRIGANVRLGEFFNGAIDDVRIYSKALTLAEIKQAMRGDPLLAWNPNPANGSTPDIEGASPLRWSPGEKVAKHDVYFGTDRDAVEDADTTTTGVYRGRRDPNSYTPPEALEWGQSYYWRIDEYNTDATISEGRVWGYTVAHYLLVDDFEPYDDYCNRIFYGWGDGWGHQGDVSCGVLPYGGNGTGSTVGYLDVPYAEQTIVHEGLQAMPFEYLNDGSTGKALYSETEQTFDPPQDWTRHNVKALTLWFRGYPASVGSFSYDPGTDIYTITADGADIWGTSDEFHYASKRLSGVGSIVVQVLSVQNTNVWAKAGVMIRETLDANSINAMVAVTPGNGVSFQWRATTGGASDFTNQTGITAPHWVRLTRSGNNFTAEHSADGATWETVGTQNIQMDSNVYIGLALTSHNGDQTVVCTGEFSDVTITGTVTGQWESQDIGIASNDAEQLYVAVEDSTGKSEVANHPDLNAVQSDTWQPWDIPLKDFSDAGVNLKSVKKIYIGLGDRNLPKLGGAGMLYIDDIRLYQPRCVPSLLRPRADFSGDCVVGYTDLEIMANEWLVDANDLQADLNLDSEVNFKDYAGLADTWLDVLLWP